MLSDQFWCSGFHCLNGGGDVQSFGISDDGIQSILLTLDSVFLDQPGYFVLNNELKWLAASEQVHATNRRSESRYRAQVGGEGASSCIWASWAINYASNMDRNQNMAMF